MPRKKQQQQEPIDYFGSLEYGMDDYDDPTEHMSPEEIRALERYVAMTQAGPNYWDGINEHEYDDDDDDEVDYPGYAPPNDNLYPGEFDNSDDEE